MWDHFFFSLSATVPVFAVMVLGHLLRRAGLLTHEFCRVSNRLVFTAALPAMLFRQIAVLRPDQIADGRFLLFTAAASVLYPLLVWLPARRLLPDKGEVGAFTQGAFRGNTALLGAVLMESICGSLTYAPLIVLAGVPVSNAFSVIILSLEADGDRPDRAALQRALAGVIKNPLIIGILLGLPFAFFRIPIPAAADKGLALLANMASPLALLVIGAEFRADAAVKKLRSTVCAGLIKLLLLPALTIFAAAALGFRGEAMVAVLVFSGTPTAVASYIMAENMHNDGVLANGIVAFTTLLSAVTVTGWIFLLRVTGLI